MLFYTYVLCLVAQLCPILCDSMDCSLPCSSVHGIFQARILEWVAISFSSGSFQPRDRTQVSHIAGRLLTIWATREIMTNLDSTLKSKDITLPTKVHLVKAMILPVVMYGCEKWTIKKAERRRIDAFEHWCSMRVPWTGWISLQSEGLSRVFSNTTVEKHQFFGAQLSLWSNFHIHTWPLEKP